MDNSNNNSGRKPPTMPTVPMDKDHEKRLNELTLNLKATGFGQLLRNKVYQRSKQIFTEALAQNPVGRALLTDPHVRNVGLERDSNGAPTYRPGQDGGPDNGVINIFSPKHKPGTAEFSAQMTHEALHKAHHQWAPDVYKKRKETKGTHEGWDNAEEEFTITGRDRAFPTFPNSNLHENAARAAMNLKPRNSHESTESDLPRDMTAHEYDAYMAERRSQATGSFTVEVRSGPPRPMPKLSSRRTKEEKKDPKKD